MLSFTRGLFSNWDSFASPPSSLQPSPPSYTPAGYDRRHGFPQVEHFYKRGHGSDGTGPDDTPPPGYHWRKEGQRRVLTLDRHPDIRMVMTAVDGTNQWVPTLDPKKFQKLPNGTPTLFEGENPPKAPKGYVYDRVRSPNPVFQLKPEGMPRIHMRQTPLGIIPTLHHEMPNA